MINSLSTVFGSDFDMCVIFPLDIKSYSRAYSWSTYKKNQYRGNWRKKFYKLGQRSTWLSRKILVRSRSTVKLSWDGVPLISKHSEVRWKSKVALPLVLDLTSCKHACALRSSLYLHSGDHCITVANVSSCICGGYICTINVTQSKVVILITVPPICCLLTVPIFCTFSYSLTMAWSNARAAVRTNNLSTFSPKEEIKRSHRHWDNG